MDNKTLENLRALKKVRENERNEEKIIRQLMTRVMIDELKRNEDKIRELIEIIELLRTEYAMPQENFDYGGIYYSHSHGIKGLYIGDILSSRFGVGYGRGGKYFISDVCDYLKEFMDGFPAYERHIYDIADKVIESEKRRLADKSQTNEVRIVFTAKGPDVVKTIFEITDKMHGVIVSFTKNDK